MGATEQRKLAAIMFTDMVGYSALTQRDEALALDLLQEHHDILRDILPMFQGNEIKSTGDGLLVEFSSALAAVQCAVEIQRTLAERNEKKSEERQIQIRIGIHLGDVVKRGDDVLGDGVNIAARIEPLAEPGGVCITRAVFEQIENKVPQSLVQLSKPELKNISANVEVYKLVLDANPADIKTAESSRKQLYWVVLGVVVLNVILFLKFGLGHKDGTSPNTNSVSAAMTSLTADQKSIAVLPFVNMSADKDNEYFSDGITEEILNALARTPGLRVAARTSAFSFKGKNESVQRIGETLKVGVVLEGSVRRMGNQLRITAQLINVADGFHLWSDTFDRKAEDVFAIQTEVAQKVQEALQVKLLAGGSTNTTLAGTDNLEAYDLYLRAKHFWNLRTADGVQRAVGLFQQATEKDSKFAAAYAGLAASYSLLPAYAAVPSRETNPKARAAAQRALELDGRQAEAHAVLAECAGNDWDLPVAEREYQEAVRVNPNHATSHHWYANFLGSMGRMEEGLAEIRKAQVLDPLSPVIQATVGTQLYWVGRYDEALVEADKALKLAPDFPAGFKVRGWIYLAQKKLPEATAEFERVRKQTGDTPYVLGELGHVYGRAGRTNEAQQILETLRRLSANGSSVGFEIAFVYLGLGDTDQAFVWLEREVESREQDPRWWKFEPFMAEITRDPRYPALLKKFGLDK